MTEATRKTLLETIKQHAQSAGISQYEIARRAGLHRSNVNRVLSGRYSPELDTFLKIVEAVNMRLELTAEVTR